MINRYFRKIENLPLLFDINGNVIGFLRVISDCDIEYQFNEATILTITFSGKKKLQVDQEIIYKDERFLVTRVENEKSNTSMTTIECTSAFIELNHKTQKKVEFIALTAFDGLKKIVTGTNWTVGYVDSDDVLHSMAEEKKTVLNLLHTFSSLTGKTLVFDTINRKVSLVNNFGKETDFVFRYRKNIKSIKRTILPPQATVLYPTGRGGLTIESVNDGTPYIENYSWYLEQGIPLKDAREKYKKEYYWEDERFIYAGTLLRAGQEKLAELSRPQISYETNVIAGAEDLKVGDYAWVIDEELDMRLKVRVVKLNIVPGREWENKIEFDYVLPGLQNIIGESYSRSLGTSSESDMVLVSNESDITVNSSYSIALEMAFSTYAPTNVQVGIVIVGIASTDLTLDGYLDVAGQRVGIPIRQKVLAGDNVLSLTFLLTQIQEGSDFLNLYLKTNTGTFTVLKNESQLFIIGKNMLGGIGAELPRANIVEEVDLSRIINVNVGENKEVTTQIPIKRSITENVIFSVLDVTDNVTIAIEEV